MFYEYEREIVGLLCLEGIQPVPVLLQRSLMHSGSARFSRAIIHSAPFGKNFQTFIEQPFIAKDK
jgi:hypothetical protein